MTNFFDKTALQRLVVSPTGAIRLRLKWCLQANVLPWPVPSYHFDIMDTDNVVGTISLRLGDPDTDLKYIGHIGCWVREANRGQRYAGSAINLLKPLAAYHGMPLLLTCNPENTASRRAIERLGSQLINIVQIPKDNIAYMPRDCEKCRYFLPCC